MANEFTDEADSLISEIKDHLEKDGEAIWLAINKEFEILFHWIGYLNSVKLTGNCDHFIDGIRSLLLESCASASAGLYRSCMFSMRAQIDLSFSWLFFKDHSIEWEKVGRENEGYKLKSEINEFLEKYILGYTKRYRLLRRLKYCEILDPYKILSSHIHSIGNNTIPLIKKSTDIIGDKNNSSDLIYLQRNVAIYISDVFMSYFGSEWMNLPTEITEFYKSRFDEKIYAELTAS